MVWFDSSGSDFRLDGNVFTRLVRDEMNNHLGFFARVVDDGNTPDERPYYRLRIIIEEPKVELYPSSGFLWVLWNTFLVSYFVPDEKYKAQMTVRCKLTRETISQNSGLGEHEFVDKDFKYDLLAEGSLTDFERGLILFSALRLPEALSVENLDRIKTWFLPFLANRLVAQGLPDWARWARGEREPDPQLDAIKKGLNKLLPIVESGAPQLTVGVSGIDQEIDQKVVRLVERALSDMRGVTLIEIGEKRLNQIHDLLAKQEGDYYNPATTAKLGELSGAKYLVDAALDGHDIHLIVIYLETGVKKTTKVRLPNEEPALGNK